MPEAQIASQAESEFVNDYYQRSRKKQDSQVYDQWFKSYNHGEKGCQWLLIY